MTAMTLILTLIGVGCVSEALTRFIVWLDAADECARAEESPEETRERRRAA